jgi:hypothetical protein
VIRLHTSQKGQNLRSGSMGVKEKFLAFLTDKTAFLLAGTQKDWY